MSILGAIRRLQLHENIHRADLTPLELGNALVKLQDDGETPNATSPILEVVDPPVRFDAHRLPRPLRQARPESTFAARRIGLIARRWPFPGLTYAVAPG